MESGQLVAPLDRPGPARRGAGRPRPRSGAAGRSAPPPARSRRAARRSRRRRRRGRSARVPERLVHLGDQPGHRLGEPAGGVYRGAEVGRGAFAARVEAVRPVQRPLHRRSPSDLTHHSTVSRASQVVRGFRPGADAAFGLAELTLEPMFARLFAWLRRHQRLVDLVLMLPIGVAALLSRARYVEMPNGVPPTRSPVYLHVALAVLIVRSADLAAPVAARRCSRSSPWWRSSSGSPGSASPRATSRVMVAMYTIAAQCAFRWALAAADWSPSSARPCPSTSWSSSPTPGSVAVADPVLDIRSGRSGCAGSTSARAASTRSAWRSGPRGSSVNGTLRPRWPPRPNVRGSPGSCTT